jgi:hypothetical protein
MSRPQDCPNCGMRPLLEGKDLAPSISVLCTNCWLSGPYAETADAAVEVWNRIRVEAIDHTEEPES